MSNNLSWRDALKEFNDRRVQDGGKYTIPKKGTPEYASVRELMGEKSDAVPLKPDQTVTGKTRDVTKSRSPKKLDEVKEKIHKAVQTLVPTDEPKPPEKKIRNKKSTFKEYEPDDKGNLVEVKQTPSQDKPKKSKKKSVATQTEPPNSPKSDDFKLKLN